MSFDKTSLEVQELALWSCDYYEENHTLDGKTVIKEVFKIYSDAFDALDDCTWLTDEILR